MPISKGKYFIPNSPTHSFRFKIKRKADKLVLMLKKEDPEMTWFKLKKPSGAKDLD